MIGKLNTSMIKHRGLQIDDHARDKLRWSYNSNGLETVKGNLCIYELQQDCEK